MDREECVEKLAQEMLGKAVAAVEAEPLNKQASEDDKMEKVAQYLEKTANDQAAVLEAAQQAFDAADQQEKIAEQCLAECGYEIGLIDTQA